MKSLLVAIALSLTLPCAALAAPKPDSRGNYTNSGVGKGHYNWLVVDPDPNGFNCRMPTQYQQVALDAVNVPEALSQDGKYNISKWPLVIRFYKGDRLAAVVSQLGAQALLLDRNSNPWIGIRVNTRYGIRDCFVRANRRFIRPIP